MTRLADFKANSYHDGELSTTSTGLVLTGVKHMLFEAWNRAAAPAQLPREMTAITSADQPATLAGDTLSNTTAIGRRWNTFDFRDAPSGSAWLTGATVDLSASAAGDNLQVGTMTVVDILWWNGQNVTTASNTSTINSPTWPARDRNGATNGDGIGIGFLAWSGLTQVTDVTMSYTASDGTGPHTALLTAGCPTGAGQASFFELAAGHVGVQQVLSLSRVTVLSSANYSLFAFRIIGQARIINTHGSGQNPLLRSSLLDFPAKIHAGSVLTAGAIMTTGLATGIGSWRARYSYSSL
jgi:hypothetical protein